MTHLAWRKKADGKVMNVRSDQLRGAVIILLVAIVVYIAKVGAHRFQTTHRPADYSGENNNSVIVELSTDETGGGIYFLPPDARMSDLLVAAGVTQEKKYSNDKPSHTLKSGDKVIVHFEEGRGPRMTLERIDAASRYVLDLPIDINTVPSEDLELIPGIGKRTAGAIVHYRKKRGRFKTVDDLMKIDAIGEKKFQGVRKYFCVETL